MTFANSPGLDKKELSELYQQFDSLGNWVNEANIGDYPALGGSIVSPKYVFRVVVNRMVIYGKPELPQKIVQTCKKMQELGYENNTITNFLINVDIEAGGRALFGGLKYVEDIYTISAEAKTKDEFHSRVIKLSDEYFSRLRDDTIVENLVRI